MKKKLRLVKRYLKSGWIAVRPSLKTFGAFSWFMTKVTLVLLLSGGIAAGGMGAGLMAGILKDIPDFDPERLERPFLPSYIYDINGDLVMEIHDEQNRIPVTIDEVPEHVIQAFLAAEDTRFYDHHGFDLRAVARSLYVNIAHPERIEGASTITQQIVKQIFLTPAKTWQRKLQELFIAIQVERQYTKDEILEFYLNNATYYGNSAYGIEAAAQTYFDKSVGELTLAEAALLAGIPNHPARYAPRGEDPENAIERRNDVLRRMANYGYITQAEARTAMEEEVVITPRAVAAWPYPHFMDAIIHTYALDALKELGYTQAEAEQALRRDGLHIHTTLDPRIQEVVEGVMMNDDYYTSASFIYPEGHSRAGRRYPQGAAVVMDIKTGYVYGLVGGREYNSTNRINRAFMASNQPGSAIKPVITYGPAFEYNVLSPASVLDDAPTAWPDSGRPSGYYAPENFARTFRGLITVREALVISDNIPALKAYDMVRREAGWRSAVEFAETLGIKFTPESHHMIGTGMGGSDYGTNVLEMAEAFSGFGNRGIKVTPIFITKILDRDGNEIFTATPIQEVVMSEETAFMMTDILIDVVQRGTARPTGLRNLNVAAKTGTTDNAHDRWTVGYSPDYVFSVWMGNDTHQVTIDGERVFIPGLTAGRNYTLLNYMFGDIARGVIGDNDKPFPGPPSTLVKATVCNKSGLLPSGNCPESSLVTDWFKRDNVPTETCDMHILVDICTINGLRATEYTPEEYITSRVFLARDYVEPTDDRWSGPTGRLPRDYHLRAPDRYCYYFGSEYSFNAFWNSDENQVVLNWEWDPGKAYDGFHIYRRAFNQEDFVRLTPELLPIGTRTWIDSFAPVPGLSYEYRILVRNTESVLDNEGEPTGQTVTRDLRRHPVSTMIRPLSLGLIGTWEENDKAVFLDWNPPQTSAAVARYNVFRNEVSIGQPLVSQYTDSSSALTRGETYSYQVSVVYLIGGVEYESVLSSKLDITIPAEATTGSIKVTKEVYDEGAPTPLPSFQVRIKRNGGNWIVMGFNDGDTATFSGLAPGKYIVEDETNEDGWEVAISQPEVTVVAGEEEPVTITYTYTPPPEETGSINVTRNVVKETADSLPENLPTFRVKVNGTTKTFTEAGTALFSDLAAKEYTVADNTTDWGGSIENDWNISEPINVTVDAGEEKPVPVTITYTYTGD